MSRIVLVVAGGDRPTTAILSAVPPPAFTIAADSGVDHARSLGLDVDLVVGDLDSADPTAVEWARAAGAAVERHRPDKDQTDLELALARATAIVADGRADEMVVIGLGGGRIDHWLANLLCLAGPAAAGASVTAFAGSARITVITNSRALTGRPGELVSLLPVGGPATGIATEGLVYRLDGEDLTPGSSRGVSNLFAAGAAPDGADGPAGGTGGGDAGSNGGTVTAIVSVRSGTLLAVQPEALGPYGSEPSGPPSPAESR